MLTNADAWIMRAPARVRPHLRLFCFPYAAGGASIFREWCDELPSSIEVVPIQLPGRENRMREPLFTRIEPLVQVLAQILPPYLDPPFALFGHSLGALIAFEVARWLAREDRRHPVHLYVSGRRAPRLPSTDRPIHQLSRATFIQAVARYNGTSQAVLQDAELMNLFLPILRADFELDETYTYIPGPLLDCPISAFGGLQDEKVDRHALGAWHEETRGGFNLRMFPGDHFFVHSARSLLLRTITQELAPALKRMDGGRL